MPIAMRKILGVVCVFLLVFGLLVFVVGLFITLNELGYLSFSYGALPTGKSIDFTMGFAVTVLLSFIGAMQASVLFFRFLSRLASHNKIELIAMLPVVILVVILCLWQLHALN